VLLEEAAHATERLRTAVAARDRQLQRDPLAARVAALGEKIGVDRARLVIVGVREDLVEELFGGARPRGGDGVDGDRAVEERGSGSARQSVSA
jgi:hypothetical protein